MKTFSKYTVIILTVALFYYCFFYDETIMLSPGIKAPKDPVQTKIESPTIINFDDYLIRPLASFKIKAKVLGIETYRTGRESDLSPYDFALGWGRMSDQVVVDNISISQRRRWYYWKASQLPIPSREIETHSANMHIIPSDSYIENILDDVITGRIVDLEGYLVFVSASDGWHWKSSLTRNDVGNGACEVFYVKDAAIIE